MKRTAAHAVFDGCLTAREREIALLIATGGSNRDIAQCLHISVRTVEHHVGAIFVKMHARSRVQVAVRVAASGFD